MGKQAVWLRAVKKAFSPSKDIDISSSTAGKNEQRKPTEEKKKKKKKRWSFGRSSSKQATPQKAISHEDFSPESGYKERSSDCIKVSSSQRKVLDGEVEQRQSEHAMAVAVATAAAAAEAAVVAAQAAAEVVRLTSAGRTSFYGDPHVEEWAAIKIQSAFRAYVARRALRALKGVVRLQALIRGHAVRRQANATLRCMQALVRVQARIRSQRACYADNRALQRQMLLRQKHEASSKFKSDGSNQEWDDNLQPPEVIQAKLQSKHVAAMKRERALAYAFSHQSWRGMGNSDSSKLTETEAGKPHWGWSWLERWMYARPWEFHSDKNGTDRFQGRNVEGPTMHVMHKSTNLSGRPRSGALNSFKPIVTGQKVVKQVTPHSPMTPRTAKPLTSNAYTASPCSIQTSNEEVNSFPVAKCTPSLSSVPPRFSSMHGIRVSLHDDESLASFSTVPSYMAITESARAKFRSQSTPKERPRSPENDASLFARKRLSFPMTESTLGFSGPLKQHSRPTGPQRSPSLKVHSGPVKSAEQSLKDSSMK